MSVKLLRSLYVLALPFAFASNSAFGACASLSALDSTYAQNFDSLSNAGKSSTLPTGWALAESGSSANNDGLYGVDDGTATGGDTYSYGAAGSTERAFGTLQSGTLIPTIGACFSNDTGGTITSIDIAYTGEEWRLGTASRTDALNFEYSLDATSLTTGTWTAVAALNFTTPDTATAGKKNGNSAGERTALSSTITGLSIASGATVWIHWIDFNASGADDGLAVDDFSLNPHGIPSGGSTNPGGTGNASPASVPNDGTTLTLLTVTPTPGTNPTSVSYTVTADLTSIGGGNSASFHDDGLNGDAAANDGTFSFRTTVAASTSTGLKSIPATVTDDQNRTGNISIALTVTQAPTPVTIMQIQGHGAASPLNSQIVTTSGIVTAINTGKGFFLQDPGDFTANPDLTASRGIYVFGSISAGQVAVGDAVTVTATVQEYSGSTELTSPTINNIASHGNALPPAYVFDDHPPTNDPTTGPCVGGSSTINPPVDGYQASNFACLDGMRVTMNDAVVTGATFGSGSDGVHAGTPNGFYAALASQPRPFHGPGALYPGISGHPEIPVWNGEPEVIEIYYKGLGFAPGSDDPVSIDPNYSDPSDYVYHAGTRFSVTGVIQGYQPSGGVLTFELYPIQMTTNTRVTPADAVKPVSDPVDGTLTIGTQNLLHFFNATADGSENNGAYNDTCAGTGAADTCPTPAEYAARLAKWTHQVCDVLKSPVVLDLEEIENYSVASDLAASIADTTSVGHAGCGTNYVPYLIPGNDVSGINIGILVRSDVQVNSVTQMYKDTLTSNCSSGTSCLLNDRPPVLLDASYNGYRFFLLAIYDRSLSSIDTKPYVGPKRAEQAAQIAYIAQALQSGATLTGIGNARQDSTGAITSGPFDIVGDAGVPLVIAGDFNAYEFSDGYADVTGMITGNAVQSDNLYWYNGYDAGLTHGVPAYVAPSPTLVDSGIKADPSQRYSFNFDGLAQEIDHIVLSRRAWRDFVRVDNAHGNSDTSEASGVILDTGTAARSGDHDGQVMTLTIDRIFADGFGQQP